MAVKIEKSTIIGDVLDIAPQTAPLFMAIGMHCLGCPSSRGETVEEACMVHGVDADAFLAQVNHFIEASEEAGLWASAETDFFEQKGGGSRLCS